MNCTYDSLGPAKRITPLEVSFEWLVGAASYDLAWLFARRWCMSASAPKNRRTARAAIVVAAKTMGTPASDVDRVVQRLYARGHRGIRFGLHRVRAVVDHLAISVDEMPSIVVAGTNGKGSVSAMLASIARLSGVSTGLYTSPHLERLAERIQVNGSPLDDAELADALERAMSKDAGPCAGELSFFETLTVAAWVAFARASVGLVVWEVGLGGRLDATNCVRHPLATAIVSITDGGSERELEHANWLGPDVATIAREKTGIAKTDSPCVVGPLREDALLAVVDEAQSRGASPIWALDPVQAIPTVSAMSLDGETLSVPDGTRYRIRPSLSGRHQLQNAAVAAAAAHLAHRAGIPLRAQIETGVASATWPGRFERFAAARDVQVILDCAHNIEGARALAATMVSEGLRAQATILVFGSLADKPHRAMLDQLAPMAQRRIYVPVVSELRSCVPPGELAARHAGQVAQDAVAGLAQALCLAQPGETVIVTGSVFLVAAVRASLRNVQSDPAIGL